MASLNCVKYIVSNLVLHIPQPPLKLDAALSLSISQ